MGSWVPTPLQDRRSQAGRPGGDKAVEKGCARYAGPKGNLQFPLDEPMPLDLIERIVKRRVNQDAEKASARRDKKARHSRKPRPSK
ncbi:MAG: hypothetical protein C0467_30805 [Planctomycetaceae bacterium]|nr:hypothetical protein [Planctomycetaceae bacterium]